MEGRKGWREERERERERERMIWRVEEIWGKWIIRKYLKGLRG